MSSSGKNDFIREYRIRNACRYQDYKRGKFTLWADFKERKEFLRKINEIRRIRELVASLGRKQAFRLLDFLCETRLWVEIGDPDGPNDFIRTVRWSIDKTDTIDVREQLANLILEFSEEDQVALMAVLKKRDAEIDRHKSRINWYTAETPSLIGKRGKAAIFSKSQWLGFFIRTLADTFIPDNTKGRNSVIAELARLCGFKCTRQNVTSILNAPNDRAAPLRFAESSSHNDDSNDDLEEIIKDLIKSPHK